MGVFDTSLIAGMPECKVHTTVLVRNEYLSRMKSFRQKDKKEKRDKDGSSIEVELPKLGRTENILSPAALHTCREVGRLLESIRSSITHGADILFVSPATMKLISDEAGALWSPSGVSRRSLNTSQFQKKSEVDDDMQRLGLSAEMKRAGLFEKVSQNEDRENSTSSLLYLVRKCLEPMPVLLPAQEVVNVHGMIDPLERFNSIRLLIKNMNEKTVQVLLSSLFLTLHRVLSDSRNPQGAVKNLEAVFVPLLFKRNVVLGFNTEIHRLLSLGAVDRDEEVRECFRWLMLKAPQIFSDFIEESSSKDEEVFKKTSLERRLGTDGVLFLLNQDLNNISAQFTSFRQKEMRSNFEAILAQIGDLMGQVDEIRDQTRALELEFSSHFKLSNDAVHRIVPAYLGLLGEPCQDPRAVQVEIEGRKKGLKKEGELALYADMFFAEFCDQLAMSFGVNHFSTASVVSNSGKTTTINDDDSYCRAFHDIHHIVVRI